jgi:DNA polymerase-1
MTLTPISRDAVDLMLQGTLCLSAIETNGIQIDVPYLRRTIRQVQDTIVELEKSMKSTAEWRIWQLMYKDKAKITSRYQLGSVLFSNIKDAKKGNLGYTCKIYTDKGAPEVSEISLQDIDLSFTKDYVKYMSLQKVLSTNLKGIHNEIDSNGILHPSFNLNTVQTYRSSCDAPNFQNFPARNNELSKMVRKCFIARPGNHFVEVDYSGAEVRCNSCINNDPKLKQYIIDPTSDMHKDMAIQIFKLRPEQVSKGIRNISKGGFVFASFYGSWWKGLAEGLWNQVRVHNPKTTDGVSLMSHLESVGLKELGIVDDRNIPERGSFYEHIKEIEADFWGNRFAVYNQWKKDTWSKYLKDGYIETPMGFHCSGVFTRNEILNIPAQSSAFHCLLWSLIQIQKQIKKHNLKTLLIGQIHDSIVADSPADELDIFLEMVEYVMTERLRKRWSWLSVPMEVEADVADIGKTWFDKKPYTIQHNNFYS